MSKLDQEIMIGDEKYVLVPYPKYWQVDEALRISKVEFCAWYVPESLLKSPTPVAPESLEEKPR